MRKRSEYTHKNNKLRFLIKYDNSVIFYALINVNKYKKFVFSLVVMIRIFLVTYHIFYSDWFI